MTSRHQIIHPCPQLAADVECFIISETAEGENIVLPDTALVMGFQYHGRLGRLENGALQLLATSGITGLQHEYNRFCSVGATGSILVRFKPGGAAPYLSFPVHELAGQSTALNLLNVYSRIAVVEAALCEASTDTARIQIVEAFLLSSKKPLPADTMVEAALAIIHQTGGLLRMDQLARKLCTSASPLEKRFRSRVGTSPKKFSRIVRLQRIIREAGRPASAAARAYEAGYFDQAHFIKDFRKFSGQTPEAFFRQR